MRGGADQSDIACPEAQTLSLSRTTARREAALSTRRRLAPVILRVVKVRVELADSCEGQVRVAHTLRILHARAARSQPTRMPLLMFVTPMRTLVALALEEFQVFDKLLLVVGVEI